MAARHITNTNTGLVRLCQYPQLGLSRPSPPALNAGHDLNPSHAYPFDLELMSALMLVLMPDYRLISSISKIRQPDAYADPNSVTGAVDATSAPAVGIWKQ
jgi:hypothetical protein